MPPLFVLLVVLGAALALQLHRVAKLKSAAYRAREWLFVLGIATAFIPAVAVAFMQYSGALSVTTGSSVLLPSIITSAIVTLYAYRQSRVIDVAYYLPWTEIHKRKTALYKRIQSAVSNTTENGSIRHAVTELAGALDCSVMLITQNRAPIDLVGPDRRITAIPIEKLREITRFIVANEVASTLPDTYSAMQHHGIAAIVPFYPNRQSGSAWILLGEGFTETIYTPLDFEMVWRLFDRLSELFLDKMVQMHIQLNGAEHRLRSMQEILQKTEETLITLQTEREDLIRENKRFAQEQATDPIRQIMCLLEKQEAPLEERVATFEKAIIDHALRQTAGNKSQAAKLLGLRPNTLHYKLERHGAKLRENKNT